MSVNPKIGSFLNNNSFEKKSLLMYVLQPLCMGCVEYGWLNIYIYLRWTVCFKWMWKLEVDLWVSTRRVRCYSIGALHFIINKLKNLVLPHLHGGWKTSENFQIDVEVLPMGHRYWSGYCRLHNIKCTHQQNHNIKHRFIYKYKRMPSDCLNGQMKFPPANSNLYI